MPRSRRLARRVGTANRMLGPVLCRLPSFGYLHHRGRRSGQAYRTPLRVLLAPGSDQRSADQVHIALTYGQATDWYRNIRSGPASFRSGGSNRPILAVDLIERSQLGFRPAMLTRLGLRLLGVDHLVCLQLGPERSVDR